MEKTGADSEPERCRVRRVGKRTACKSPSRLLPAMDSMLLEAALGLSDVSLRAAAVAETHGHELDVEELIDAIFALFSAQPALRNGVSNSALHANVCNTQAWTSSSGAHRGRSVVRSWRIAWHS